MLTVNDEVDNDGSAAISWFGETLDVGEWINHSWIGRHGAAEVRMVDIVCADATHRMLYRLVPSDDPVNRVNGLTYEQMRGLADKFLKKTWKHGFIVDEFAGPATSMPGFDDVKPLPQPAVVAVQESSD